MPVTQPLSEAPRGSRLEAREAERHLRRFDSILRARYGRSGWDDRGGDLTVLVNMRSMGGNAYFAALPSGAGELGIGVRDARIGFRQSAAHSPTILFHELLHGVMASELRDVKDPDVASVIGHREHAAISESASDVIGAALLDTGWRVGHEIRAGAPLRDLAEPSVPRFTKAVRTDAGLREHSLSGILSRAAVLAAETGGRLAVADAWFAAMDTHYRRELDAVRTPGSGRALGAWVRATMRGAEQIGGAGSDLVDAVRAGWREVGLGRYAAADHMAEMRTAAQARRRRRAAADD